MEACIKTKAEKTAEYNAKYYREHRAATLARKKIYHVNNKEALNKKSSEYNKSAAGHKSLSKYKAKNSVKVSAHNEVNKAMQRGDIERLPCECCGNEKAEAHHDDYLKPLDVRFLCREHHIKWHQENGEGMSGAAQ